MTIGDEFKFDGKVKSIGLSLLSGDVLTFNKKLGLGIEEHRNMLQ